MHIIRKAVAGALLAGAALAPSAQAQVNYSTTGVFTSALGTCNATTTCVNGGVTLTYVPKAPNPGLIGSGSIVSLGDFTLTGTGSATFGSPAVLFTLTINQSNPTVGTGSTAGSITGTATFAPDFSSVIWTPSPQTVFIGSTSYQLIFDTVGPAAGKGINIAINNALTPTRVNALVTATPEPASMTLLATGLVGVFGAARRRRNKQA